VAQAAVDDLTGVEGEDDDVDRHDESSSRS
jgi:hypothetical protein